MLLNVSRGRMWYVAVVLIQCTVSRASPRRGKFNAPIARSFSGKASSKAQADDEVREADLNSRVLDLLISTNTYKKAGPQVSHEGAPGTQWQCDSGFTVPWGSFITGRVSLAFPALISPGRFPCENRTRGSGLRFLCINRGWVLFSAKPRQHRIPVQRRTVTVVARTIAHLALAMLERLCELLRRRRELGRLRLERLDAVVLALDVLLRAIALVDLRV